MYSVEICVRCNAVDLAGRFLTRVDMMDAWDYIGRHPESAYYEPCVCIDCHSEIGTIAAEQLIEAFNERVN